MRFAYHLLIGLAFATLVLAAPNDNSNEIEEGRDNLRKAILPFLIGIVLKASTLVPLKLLLMTFVVIMALITSKMGLALALITGMHQHYHPHPSVPTDIAAFSSNVAPVYAPTSPGNSNSPPPSAMASQQPSQPSAGDQYSSSMGPHSYIRRVHYNHGK